MVPKSKPCGTPCGQLNVSQTVNPSKILMLCLSILCVEEKAQK